MSLVLIRQALETAVAAITPKIDSDFENSGYAPKPKVPYQVVTLIPAVPENPTLGSIFVRERGLLQIVLRYPIGVGPQSAAGRAELVKATFFQGASFVKSFVTVITDKTPQVAPGFTDADRWCVPIRIPYFCNIPG
jgi:hypothetical protein